MSRTRYTRTYVLCTLILLLAGAAYAGGLEKRSRIEVKFGMWNGMGTTQSITAFGGNQVASSVKGSGMIGAVGYGYWLQENLSVNFEVSLLAVDASSEINYGTVSQHAVSVLPLQVGVRYYLPQATLRTPWRPYVSAAAGPILGTESRSEVSGQVVQSTRTLASFGGRVGGGLDVQLSRLFMLGVDVGYNLMADFPERLGGEDNFSGPAFGIGISLLLGRGVAQP